MDEKKRALKILKLLEKDYGAEFETALDWKKDWQLLVAVVLSAQTTDENVNSVTKKLFKKYKTPQSLGDASLSELEKDVYSTGYYRAKAKAIKNLGLALAKEHNGSVPDSMKELVKLPGVGRKTANVILHVLHNKSEGIVMDTHIARLTHRLGFTDKKDPKLGEEVMMQVLPNTKWKEWGDLLIQHGREVCDARKPKCDACSLNKICPSAFNI